jgi:hypothetical protein
MLLLLCFFLAADRSAAAAPSSSLFSSGVPPSPALAACLNSGDDGDSDPLIQPTIYRDFVEGRPTSLRYWAGRWSAKKGLSGGGDEAGGGAHNNNSAPLVTIASSLTSARLEQLEAQCRMWRGPLSAVVYAPVRALEQEEREAAASSPRPAEPLSALLSASARRELDATTQLVATLHARAESHPEWCALDVAVVFEVVGDDLTAAVLPVNAMRNLALLQARTPLVAMLDVDLLPSSSLSDWLLLDDDRGGRRKDSKEQQKKRRQLQEDLRRACERSDALFVLPAFETPRLDDIRAAHSLAEHAARAATKQDLAAMVSRKQVWQFALPIFHEGHDDTDYRRWFGTAAGAPLRTGAYSVRGTKDFEPWFLVGRARNPWYDSRFRGYGWNKVTHVAHAAAAGFEFRVLPSGWVVHRQHSRSQVDRLYQSQKRRYEQAAAVTAKNSSSSPSPEFETVAGVTHRFRDAVVASLARGDYKPVVSEGLRRCVASLPWWREEVVGPGSRAVEQALGGGGAAAAAADGNRGISKAGANNNNNDDDDDRRACFIGQGPAGEAAALEAVLKEYGGPLPAPEIGGARRRRREARRRRRRRYKKKSR